ncbi:MAG: hypothetical protein LH606_16125 [Cytophagaceae bacterium]|nr:hypothetical protein [Cytophagaceae bacterium]
MASYNLYDNDDLPLWDRFLSISKATEQNETFKSSFDFWQKTFNSNNPLPSEDDMVNLLNNLRTIPVKSPKIGCPRLFVSHRQIDKDYALSIANIANDTGFEFWLDVLDPTLLTLPTLTHLTPKQIVLLTACIIEMGLINSTHVIAVMTEDSKGSVWIPYEYGRVRKFDDTACWSHPNHTFTLPDYMLLGPITGSRLDIEEWLRRFHCCSPITWVWPKTKSLPTRKSTP